MDPARQSEESLREAACFGDEEAIRSLLKSGVNVNVQHPVNGWTALHWASRRGYVSIVRFLLTSGADPSVTATKGETAIEVASNEEIKGLLSGKIVDVQESPPEKKSNPLPIVPNYLAHPPIAHKVDIKECVSSPRKVTEAKPVVKTVQINTGEELVVKVRTSNPPNQDFIEVEVPLRDLSFSSLLKICCEELEVNRQKVVKLRKLPNTILRKDKDVFRLVDFTELEVVLLPDEYVDFSMTNGFSRCYATPEINGFIKNMSALNRSSQNAIGATSLLHKSSICKDGVILY